LKASPFRAGGGQKVDNIYAPAYGGGIIWNDPKLGIDWPVDELIMLREGQKMADAEGDNRERMGVLKLFS